MGDQDDEDSSLKEELKKAIRDNVVPFPNPKKKRVAKKPSPIKIAGDRNIVGDHNTFIEGNAHFNSKVIHHTTVQPGPQHITPAQAHRLQELVKEAVECDFTSGQQTIKQLFSKWYTLLRNKFKANRYDLIPAELGDQAIKWMQRQVAMLRPKLRRKDNKTWRNQHYKAIWARSRELGFTKDQVYDLSAERLDKPITSLKQLGERNLEHLYNIIMAIPRRS